MHFYIVASKIFSNKFYFPCKLCKLLANRCLQMLLLNSGEFTGRDFLMLGQNCLLNILLNIHLNILHFFKHFSSSTFFIIGWCLVLMVKQFASLNQSSWKVCYAHFLCHSTENAWVSCIISHNSKRLDEFCRIDRIYPECAVNKEGLSVPSVWHSLWFP